MASDQQPTLPVGEITANGDTPFTEAQVPTPETAIQNGNEFQAHSSPDDQSATELRTQSVTDSQPVTPTEAPPNPRLQALTDKKASLEATLAELQQRKAALVSASTLPSGLAMPDAWTDEEKATSALATANGVIKDHIDLLHKYNEIKDIAQGLMGIIAESRGVRQKVVEEEYGMDAGD